MDEGGRSQDEGRVQVGLHMGSCDRSMKKAVWGVFLILMGLLFLLEHFGVFGFHGIGPFWPFIFFVLAVINVLEGKIGSAVMMAFLGTWFLAVTNGYLGLTWNNSWPLALIAVGAGIVVGALTGQDRHDPRGGAS